VKNFKLGFYCK